MNIMTNFITDRKELAKAINFGKYPVLTMEIGNHYKDYEGLFKGCDVRVAWDNSRYPDMASNCRLTIEIDRDRLENYVTMDDCKEIKLTQGCACLKASFGYSDLMDMVHWANTPLIHKGEEVVVVFNDSVKNTAFVKKMVVDTKIDTNCSVVTTLKDIVSES